MKDAWKNWPVRGAVLGIAVVAALAFVYLTSVKDREHYLQSRNFRLLAVIARQTEQLIDARSRVYGKNIDTLCARKPVLCRDLTRDQWTAWPYQDPLIDESNPATRELAAGQIRNSGAGLDLASPIWERSKLESLVSSDGTMLQFEWFSAGNPPIGQQAAKGSSRSVAVRVSAADTLHGIFDPRLEQRAFDTLILSDLMGRIVYVTGRRAAELRGTSLADLLTLPSDATAITRTAAQRSVSLAGVEYLVFMQPCCGNGTATRSEGLVVAGLVERQAMLDASLAISPVLVLAGVVLVIALLVGWSFLKVALIGSQQRVTRIDVLQLGASGIFGLALATILLLTSSTYARLSADVDAQLAQLADRLHSSLSNEVGRAASQLSSMLTAISNEPCIKAEENKELTEAPCKELVSLWSSRKTLPPDLSRHYPDFSAFTLVDTSGFQRIKAASSEAARRRVDVSDRAYFSRARDREALWQLAQCPNSCTLEQLWSWTTGKFQVVMSTPTNLKHMPVAALSTSMKPLLEPVLPPGFEFAIVDQNGLVQFHSDKQRILSENLLLETDQDARLQSLAATHGAGTLNMSYWGRPYRAYVRPTIIPGWSVVTLHAKQPSRALVLEWSTVALLMQAGYMVLWIALTLALMTAKATWLWPDPRRRPWYRALSILYVVALWAWLLVASRASLGTTMILGLLLPPALWGITCLTLVPRPKDTGQAKAWSDLCREYRAAAALMLTITAAVPATCFFMLSAEQHLQAYLKKQHIDLAHEVDVVEKCPKPDDALVSMPDYRYDDVFYGSHVTCHEAHAQTRVRARTPFSRIEEYLPYFTSASAPLRQLMHLRSDDDAWTSDTGQAGLLSVAVASREPGYSLSVESPLLPAFGIASLGDEPHLALTAMTPLVMLLGIAFGAYWIVGYLLRRVVLADVVEPIGTNGHLVTSPGQRLLVICRNPRAKVKKLVTEGDLKLRLTPVVIDPVKMSNAWREARRTISDVGALQRIVIPDIDEQSQDVSVMRRKLMLIEELMREPELTLLLLTASSKRALENSVRDSLEGNDEPDRWSKVIARLTVTDIRPTEESGSGNQNTTTTLETWWSEFRRAPKEVVRYWWNGSGHDRNWRETLLTAEEQGCSTVAPFCGELRDSRAFNSMGEDQILEELEERAGSIYRNVWQSCDEDERVVLEHVAQHGLTSTTSRRVVRRLLARGLLRKDPELRLMNRSFRRFVLEAERRREVVILESQAGPSLWDRLRLPLGAGALIGVTFLAATQREAFNATLTVATGVTGLVPMLMKFTNVLSQFTAKGDSKMNG
jgi:hypothetical protein